MLPAKITYHTGKKMPNIITASVWVTGLSSPAKWWLQAEFGIVGSKAKQSKIGGAFKQLNKDAPQTHMTKALLK